MTEAEFLVFTLFLPAVVGSAIGFINDEASYGFIAFGLSWFGLTWLVGGGHLNDGWVPDILASPTGPEEFVLAVAALYFSVWGFLSLVFITVGVAVGWYIAFRHKGGRP